MCPVTDLLSGARYMIVQGDCVEGLRTLEGADIPLFATSPPYAQGLEYEQGLDYDGLRELIASVAQAAFGAAAPSGFFFVNFGETTKYTPRTMAQLYTDAFTDAGWIMHSRRIWAKKFSRCGLGPSLIAHTIGAAEFEHIWTFRKPPNSKEIHRARKLSLRSIWTTAEPIGVSKSQHPAAFPTALPAKAIRVWSDPGDIICDPFCGSGSTGVAALELGRRFIGFELRPDYVALAEKRLSGARMPLAGLDDDAEADDQPALLEVPA